MYRFWHKYVQMPIAFVVYGLPMALGSFYPPVMIGIATIFVAGIAIGWLF